MRQFKHFLAGAVVFLLVAALLPAPVASAENVTVSIDAPAEDVDSGSDFVAAVSITEVTGLDSLQFNITYDPGVITVNDVTAGLLDSTTVPVDMWAFIPSGTQGEIGVLGNIPGISGVAGSGYLAEIHFHVVGSPGESSDITFFNGKLFNNMGEKIAGTEWVGGSVSVSGAVTQPIISRSPSSLSFSATRDGNDPADQILKIWNSGVGTLDWEVSEGIDWLNLSPGSGSSDGEKDEVTVSVDISGMTAGGYEGIVSISATGVSTKTVSVE